MTKIFISYSRVDCHFVELMAEKIRRLHGHDNVWFDEGLHGGDIWWEEILDQIAACDIFIYVLTNDSVQSPYCQAEFAEARRLQKQIITVQARDRTRLTDELGDIQYVSMAHGVDDADALTDLFRSISKRMTKVPKRQPRPLWEPRTPKPERVKERSRPDDDPAVDTPTLRVPRVERERIVAAATKPWWKKTEFVIGAVLIPVIAAVIGILPWLLGQLSNNQPTPMPTTVVDGTSVANWPVRPGPTLTPTAELETSISSIFLPTVVSTRILAPSTTPTLLPVVTPTNVAINQDWESVEISINRESVTTPLVKVPAGCFHTFDTREQICLPTFWIGKYEVSLDEYLVCVRVGDCVNPLYISDTRYFGSNRPIVWVTVQQAETYCDWFGDGTLPSEHEWEYAAAGPSGWRYPWGNERNYTLVNYCDVSCDSVDRTNTYNDGYQYSAPVGSFSEENASWVGAYDMVGNVWEYTSRRIGLQVVSRGGSYLRYDPSSYDRAIETDVAREHFGFRCVFAAPPIEQ